jgi:hypothetical protein
MLEPEDERYERLIGRRRTIARVMLWSAAACLIFLFVYGVGQFIFKSYHNINGDVTDRGAVQGTRNADSAAANKGVKIDTTAVPALQVQPSLPDAQPPTVQKSVRASSQPVPSPVVRKKPVVAVQPVSSLPKKRPHEETPRPEGRVSGRQVEPEQESRQFGYLEIYTNPPWVKITIDNMQWGQTPKTRIIPLPEGTHVLELQKDGFEPVRQTFTVTAADTVSRRIRLNQIQ